MLRNNYLTALFVLYIATTQAQEKLWEINLNEKLYKVGWIEQTKDGLVLAAGYRAPNASDQSIRKMGWIYPSSLETHRTATA